MRRAGGCCEYCRTPVSYSADPFSAEHIKPAARGGTPTLENLAFSCQGCNNHKFTSVEAIDLVTAEMVPLFNPRTERWSDHFAWSEDSTTVIGLTAIGRATIGKLRLNRPGVVNLRRLLNAAGRHPPPE
jgi:hypothetical protein